MYRLPCDLADTGSLWAGRNTDAAEPPFREGDSGGHAVSPKHGPPCPSPVAPHAPWEELGLDLSVKPSDT